MEEEIIESNYKHCTDIRLGDKVTIIRNSLYQDKRDWPFIGRTGLVIAATYGNLGITYSVIIDSIAYGFYATFNFKELFKIDL